MLQWISRLMVVVFIFNVFAPQALQAGIIDRKHVKKRIQLAKNLEGAPTADAAEHNRYLEQYDLLDVPMDDAAQLDPGVHSQKYTPNSFLGKLNNTKAENVDWEEIVDALDPLKENALTSADMEVSYYAATYLLSMINVYENSARSGTISKDMQITWRYMLPRIYLRALYRMRMLEEFTVYHENLPKKDKKIFADTDQWRQLSVAKLRLLVSRCMRLSKPEYRPDFSPAISDVVTSPAVLPEISIFADKSDSAPVKNIPADKAASDASRDTAQNLLNQKRLREQAEFSAEKTALQEDVDFFTEKSMTYQRRFVSTAQPGLYEEPQYLKAVLRTPYKLTVREEASSAWMESNRNSKSESVQTRLTLAAMDEAEFVVANAPEDGFQELKSVLWVLINNTRQGDDDQFQNARRDRTEAVIAGAAAGYQNSTPSGQAAVREFLMDVVRKSPMISARVLALGLIANMHQSEMQGKACCAKARVFMPANKYEDLHNLDRKKCDCPKVKIDELSALSPFTLEERNEMVGYAAEIYYSLTREDADFSSYGLDSQQMKELADNMTSFVELLSPIVRPQMDNNRAILRGQNVIFGNSTTPSVYQDGLPADDPRLKYDLQLACFNPSITGEVVAVFSHDNQKVYYLHTKNKLNHRKRVLEGLELAGVVVKEIVEWVAWGVGLGIAFKVISTTIKLGVNAAKAARTLGKIRKAQRAFEMAQKGASVTGKGIKGSSKIAEATSKISAKSAKTSKAGRVRKQGKDNAVKAETPKAGIVQTQETSLVKFAPESTVSETVEAAGEISQAQAAAIRDAVSGDMKVLNVFGKEVVRRKVTVEFIGKDGEKILVEVWKNGTKAKNKLQRWWEGTSFTTPELVEGQESVTQLLSSGYKMGREVETIEYMVKTHLPGYNMSIETLSANAFRDMVAKTITQGTKLSWKELWRLKTENNNMRQLASLLKGGQWSSAMEKNGELVRTLVKMKNKDFERLLGQLAQVEEASGVLKELPSAVYGSLGLEAGVAYSQAELAGALTKTLQKAAKLEGQAAAAMTENAKQAYKILMQEGAPDMLNNIARYFGGEEVARVTVGRLFPSSVPLNHPFMEFLRQGYNLPAAFLKTMRDAGRSGEIFKHMTSLTMKQYVMSFLKFGAAGFVLSKTVIPWMMDKQSEGIKETLDERLDKDLGQDLLEVQKNIPVNQNRTLTEVSEGDQTQEELEESIGAPLMVFVLPVMWGGTETGIINPIPSRIYTQAVNGIKIQNVATQAYQDGTLLTTYERLDFWQTKWKEFLTLPQVTRTPALRKDIDGMLEKITQMRKRLEEMEENTTGTGKNRYFNLYSSRMFEKEINPFMLELQEKYFDFQWDLQQTQARIIIDPEQMQSQEVQTFLRKCRQNQQELRQIATDPGELHKEEEMTKRFQERYSELMKLYATLPLRAELLAVLKDLQRIDQWIEGLESMEEEFASFYCKLFIKQKKEYEALQEKMFAGPQDWTEIQQEYKQLRQRLWLLENEVEFYL